MVEEGHKGALREQGRAAREHWRAEGEHIDEMGVSGGAKRRHLSQRAVTCWLGFGDIIYIYVYIYCGQRAPRRCVLCCVVLRYDGTAPRSFDGMGRG